MVGNKLKDFDFFFHFLFSEMKMFKELITIKNPQIMCSPQNGGILSFYNRVPIMHLILINDYNKVVYYIL